MTLPARERTIVKLLNPVVPVHPDVASKLPKPPDDFEWSSYAGRQLDETDLTHTSLNDLFVYEARHAFFEGAAVAIEDSWISIRDGELVIESIGTARTYFTAATLDPEPSAGSHSSPETEAGDAIVSAEVVMHLRNGERRTLPLPIYGTD